MSVLQKEFEEQIKKFPYQLATKLVKDKLLEQGITLSDKKLKKLMENAFSGKEVIKFWSWKFWKKEAPVNITLTSEDIDFIMKRYHSFIDKGLTELIIELSDQAGPEILIFFQKEWPKQFKTHQKERQDFCNRLSKRWGKALRSLGLMIEMARQLGSSVQEQIDDEELADKTHMAEALIRLHARACQVAEEILCLLSNGFADGAIARWRTLHEITTVSLLLSDHGEELAERYILHEGIESRKAALQYQAACHRLGEEELSQADIDEIEENYQELKTRFGENFLGDYGWGASLTGKKNTNFSDLEKISSLDHLRPYYKLASHNVHANPKGLFFKVGALTDTEFLLAGLSNAGLEVAGCKTALSLAQVSSALMMLDPKLDHLVIVKMMQNLSHTIDEEFMEAHEILVKDEEDLLKSAS